MISTTTRRAASVSTLALSLAALTNLAWADEAATAPPQPEAAAPVAAPTPAPVTRIVDSKAVAVYDKMRAVYRNLNSYSMTALTKVVDPSGKISYQRAEFSYRKPNRFAMKVTSKGGGYSTISNGRTFYARESSSPKKYYALPMPPEEVGPLSLMQYRAAGSVFTPILAGVDSFTPPWGTPAKSITMGKPQVVAGAPADVVIFELPRSSPKTTLTYIIDRKSRLLRRAEMKAVMGKQSFTMQESYTDVKLNPALRLETFTFVPPAGATQTGSGKEEVSWNPTLKAGGDVPAFTATDLEGKPINLEEYKGKVVLLDFWATWCSPCVEEVPFIKAAYDKYHAQGMEIVSISFDEDHAAVDAFTRAFGITWRQVCDGKAFESEINKDFKVTAIPFMLLIGRDGKIAAINPRTLMLEPAVKKALAQK